MYCENCGTSVNAGATFCLACGNKIGASEVSQPKPQRKFASDPARQPSHGLQKIVLGSVPMVLSITLLFWLLDGPIIIGGTPAQIRELVFEKSEFAQPVTLDLPAEDDRKMFDEFSRVKTVKYAVIVHPFGLRGIDGNVLSFLIRHGYAKAEKVTVHLNPGGLMRAFAGSETIGFLFYTDKLKPYVLQASQGVSQGPIQVRAATRNLKSIDFTNQYEGSPMGVKIKFHSVNFTYSLDEKLPGLPKISKQFRGSAKAYLNPDNGQWMLEEIQLEDSRGQEFARLISNEYENWHKVNAEGTKR